ncbi:MAG: ribosomal protein [Candidatus Saccharibacteria bacterium]|nr:ribosomal protein [Candidatus Saccharibacteria bacterium]
MKFNELISSRAKSSKRVGRGIAAGQGKTAGRGTKGYGSRTGSKAKPGFTGGQNPLMQKLPKLPGFRSHRTAAENVYTGQLNALSGKTVTTAVLAEAGLISSAYVNVKLIAKGEVSKAVTVELQSASSKAIEALENAGGSFKSVPRTGRPSKKADKPA